MRVTEPPHEHSEPPNPTVRDLFGDQAWGLLHGYAAEREQAHARAQELLSTVDADLGRLICQAVVIYVGDGYPGQPAEERGEQVGHVFGRQQGPKLVGLVDAVLDDLDSIAPSPHGGDPDPGVLAAEQMAERHPWLDPAALNCLRLAYDWWTR